MTATNCDLFTHNQSQSYLNHLVLSATSGLYLPQQPVASLLNATSNKEVLARAESS
jgi:hypothetical protein